MVKSAPRASPRQSVVRLFFLFFRSSNFEFPPRIKKRKNWREIHPLDPLKVGTFCIVVLLIVALAATGLIRSKEFPGGSVQWLPV